EDLVSGWMTAVDRRLLLGTAYDDDEKHTLVAVGFSAGSKSRDGSDFAYVYIPIATIREWYPNVQPISSYILDHEKFGGFTLDDNAIDVFRDQYAAGFCEVVYQDLLTEQGALLVALSYAMSDVGEASM